MRALFLGLFYGLFFQAGALAQSPGFTRQPVEVLSLHNGQQLLIELNGQGRTLRLACLQAPRATQQPYERLAAQALSEVVQPGAQAEFELRARDVYGRLVGRLILQGRDVGADLIRRGAVFAWDGFVGRCDDLDYVQLELEARESRSGVWSSAEALASPWDVMETDGAQAP